ncbi:GT-D fold domain-containing glycosyltransferase [Chryseobacterium salivictor]|uniref:Glycosyltransferase GT-D fold domain-containing protein n=1 Tax=Chryseobacterium salivictor TaxID=2547600 RepID=A0A4P6ZFF9_9FLAO|nr:GT-D fold domain-containing glycosyltransferase [Chryseobacterium salivictor]QBO58360.1 hypothetical protein NBC122_01545 [Chryseobacterium salivictor]
MKWSTIVVHQFNKALNVFKLNISDTGASIELLCQNNFSMARYGDGELNIMMGGDIHFQPYNSELAGRLKEILRSYDEQSALKIGVPLAINTTAGYNKTAKDFWEMNLSSGRMHWFRYCGLRKKFINASLTRCYIDYEEKEQSLLWFQQIQALWRNKKVLVVEGAASRMGVQNNLFDNTASVNRIITKSSDAWIVYAWILETTLKVAKNYDLILVSLGPTATVLAADVSKHGYRILDIGHISLEYDEYQNDGLGVNQNDCKIKYQNQIIEQIF